MTTSTLDRYFDLFDASRTDEQAFDRSCFPVLRQNHIRPERTGTARNRSLETVCPDGLYG